MNKFRGECEITIGGEKRPMVFNLNSYALASEGMKLSIDEYEKALTDHRQTRAFIHLLHGALVTGAERAGKEVDFTHFDVGDWLVEIEQGELNNAVAAIEAAGKTNLQKSQKNQEGSSKKK